MATATAALPSMEDLCICPLTQVLMTDPVVDPEGNSYERSAILDWLGRNPTSPITRTPLEASSLVTNRFLRDVIEKLKADQAGMPAAGAGSASAAAGGASAGAPVLAAAAAAGGGGGGAAAGAAAAAARPGLRVAAVRGAEQDGSRDLMLTFEATPEVVDKRGRGPVDIVCVLDVSGSMGTEATLKTDKDVESHGLSLLDVVKHAVATIANTMSEADRLGIVAYSDSAWKVLDLTFMDAAGKKKAVEAAKALKPGGRTNLWGGLKEALDMCRAVDAGVPTGRAKCTMLLTDGCPNIAPARGNLPSLQRYIEQAGNGMLPCTLSAFGFGYQMDSELLQDLANAGHGSYAFIPDASFVGTIFINATSNILATAAPALAVEVAVPGGGGGGGGGGEGSVVDARRVEGLTPFQCEPPAFFKPSNQAAGRAGGETRRTYFMGSLMHGQARNILIPMSPAGASAASGGGGSGGASGGGSASDDLREVHVKVTVGVGNMAAPTVLYEGPVPVAAGPGSEDEAREVEVQRARLSAVVAISRAQLNRLVDSSRASAEVSAAAEEVAAAAGGTGDDRLRALLKDVRGQVALAFSAEHYDKWGQHYLPSLLRAHALQMCNNFKDPGVQVYGGRLFQALRDDGDEIFNKLPAPTPSCRPQRRFGGGYGGVGNHIHSLKHGTKSGNKGSAPAARRAAAPAPRINMASYNNCYGGCFDGVCLVDMADGSTRPASEVRRGDRVAVPDLAAAGPASTSTSTRTAALTAGAEVLCVVRTNCPDGVMPMVDVTAGGKMSSTQMSKNHSSSNNLTRLTAWHPVFVEKKWQFPAHVGGGTGDDLELVKTPAVYDYVLDSGHVISVGGRPCVTLGHGLTGPVVEHAFFGDMSRVRPALEGLRGWQDGLVDLDAGRCLVHDQETGRVCGFKQ